MSTLYDSYITGDDNHDDIYGSATYRAQTFTTTATYTIDSVLLKLYKTGNPGTLVVTIKETTDNHPNNINLVSGTYNANLLGTDTAGTWVTITFTSATALVNGTKYAICLSAAGATVDNRVCIRCDGSAPSYTTGNREYSNDSGGTWSTDVTIDWMFQTYGTIIPRDKKYSKSLVAIGNGEVWYESSVGTMVEVTAANGDVNTIYPLSIIEAYQKVFIANKTNLKILDLVNTKLTTTDIKPSGKVIPLKGTVLTGGTSSAKMVVDYIDASDATCNVYGFRTTNAMFANNESITGTVTTTDDVTFTTSAAEYAPPHWYNWTVYSADATTYGTMPTSSSLIGLYRGRIVFNDDLRPYAWYMTKVGDPFKIKYDYANDGDLSGLNYSNTQVGLLADILTAIIPYKDDLIIFGCANTIWLLVGDPLASGQLAEITDKTGIWGGRTWCIDDRRNLYFLGNDGVYRMPISEIVSPIENISRIQLPNLIKNWDLDKSLHRILFSFDPINYGILITKTTLADGTCEGYWYDLTTQGWFPESYPSSCGIFSSYFYPATDETYKKFLVGSNDGYIREFDWSTKNDTTTSSTQAINSYLTIVRPLTDDDSKEGLLQSMSIVLAGGAASGEFADTDSLSYALYKANDAETCLEDIIDGATAFISSSWTGPGKKNKILPRMRGTYMGIKLYNNIISETFAIEKLFADIFPKGEK